ncbi:unnamed protein product [Haemonchus placei]|uniref:Secreted protein n=1 Tax=Haemonchus placei TaxID=6290 RepID=A0A0N4WGS8_HAEPC|nr:unnamed protein product [Haemonchus placei]
MMIYSLYPFPLRTRATAGRSVPFVAATTAMTQPSRGLRFLLLLIVASAGSTSFLYRSSILIISSMISCSSRIG